MSEPTARTELNHGRWPIWVGGQLLAAAWFQEDAESIVKALNHECAATHEQVERLIEESEAEIESHKCAATPEQVKALQDAFAATAHKSVHRNPVIADGWRVMKELGYE